MNLNQGVNVYKLFFLIVMLTCYLNATDIMKSGHEAGKWSMDFQAVSKYAKENDKAILINFTGSDWCGWCQMMHKGVFADNAWSKFAKDNLSLAYIDFPRDKSKVPIAYQQSNEELKQRFQVQGYPTYVLLSSDGTEVLGRLGASRGADALTFISKVKNLLPQKEGKLPDFTLLEHQNEEVDSLNEKLLSFINADEFTRNIVYEDTYDKLKSLLQKDPILLSTLNGKGIVELMIYGDLNKIKEMTDLIKKSVESGAPEDSLYKEFNLLVDDNDLDSLFKCMSFYAAFGQREKAISFLPPLDRLKEAQTIEEVSPWISLLKTVNTRSYLDLCFAVQQKDIATKDKIEMVKNIANHCSNADESFMDLWFSDLVKSDELVQALKSYFDSKIQSIQKSKNYNQRATDLASNMRVFNRMSEIKVSPQLSRTALRYWQLEYAFTLMEQRKEKPQPPSMNNRPNNRRPPKFVPFVTIAENSPSVKTLSGLSYAEQELFAFQYAVADLKKGEYNANSFDRLLSFKDQYPKTVAQLCSEIFITWAQKANPNKTNQSRMIQSRGQVFRTEPWGIPLTRMRQEQNLKACKEMVAKAYQAGIEVDDEAVVRAFTSCFSQAEIVDESDVRLVFGDLSPYSDKLVLELCQRLVDMIERDWTNDKNNRRIQQQFMTNRTEIQIQEETVRAYNAVINLLDERLKNGGKSIHLTVILAGTYFDLAEYRRKKNLSTPEEQAKLRNEAFANLRACTKLYEEMLRDRKTDYTISPFSNWFSIILGASQIQNLKVTAAISDAYLQELKGFFANGF